MELLKIVATLIFAFIGLLMFGNSLDLVAYPDEWPKQVFSVMILGGCIAAIVGIWG